MTEKKPQAKKEKPEIDYVFSRYPLWIRYSGLPKEIGVVAWAVFQRLLELRYRFNSTKFHYSLEKLCDTTGVSGRGAIRRVLKRLCEIELLKYMPSHGRGQEAVFEILEPLKTPTPEEEIYRTQERLRPKGYNNKVSIKSAETENGSERSLLIENGSVGPVLEKNGSERSLLEAENGSERSLLEAENGSERSLLEKKTDPRDPPLKKTYIKRQQQQKDLFISGPSNDSKSAPGCSEPFNDGAVVAFNTQNLKEYGISGELADRYIRMYGPHYLEEKIEILEYKRLKGEQIRNPGGMLKKAIEEDWQRPEGFSTRAQREEAAKAAKDAEEAEKRKEKERKEKIRREEETAAAAEEWKKTAPPELLTKIRERAIQEVKTRFPDTDESLLRVPIRLEENKIIAKEYIDFDST